MIHIRGPSSWRPTLSLSVRPFLFFPFLPFFFLLTILHCEKVLYLCFFSIFPEYLGYLLLLSYSLPSLFSFCISRICQEYKTLIITAAPHSGTPVTFPRSTESMPSNPESTGTEEKIWFFDNQKDLRTQLQGVKSTYLTLCLPPPALHFEEGGS